MIKRNNKYEKIQGLTKKELGGELKFMLKTYLKSLVWSIKNKNDLIEVEDCYEYIYERIGDNQIFESNRNFYVWSKHRLINFYKKVSREIKRENDFNNFYCFISDRYIVNNDELICLLLTVNSKFNIYLKNKTFYCRGKIDYRKFKKHYISFINNNNLTLTPNRKAIKCFIEESILESNIITSYDEIEYQDFRDYNNYIGDNYEVKNESFSEE